MGICRNSLPDIIELAQDDIRRRAAQAIAEEIRNRLAAYFAKAAQVKAQSGKPQ